MSSRKLENLEANLKYFSRLLKRIVLCTGAEERPPMSGAIEGATAANVSPLYLSNL
jgi:hypothetical protein